jgi:hypothetical protein
VGVVYGPERCELWRDRDLDTADGVAYRWRLPGAEGALLVTPPEHGSRPRLLPIDDEPWSSTPAAVLADHLYRHGELPDRIDWSRPALSGHPVPPPRGPVQHRPAPGGGLNAGKLRERYGHR